MGEQRRYELRIFDRTLIEFAIADTPFGPEVNLEDYDQTAHDLMPCGIALNPDGIWNWLEARSIPTNRKNASQICRSLGFELGDREALYRTSLGLSLNDAYWIVPRGFQGRFDDYNLYENAFSEAIGALAVASEPNVGTLKGNTPELTTDGTLRKGWRIINGRRVLYKGASEGYVPGEPVSEYVASLIGQDVGLDIVTYGIDAWEGELCSTCEDFATKALSYVPFAVATGETGLAGVLRWCLEMGDAYLEQACDMLTFDALICNNDRHLTNFGIMRDNVTGLPIGLAPIFDNGRGLFPNVSEDDPKQFALESELRSPAFGGISFTELVSRIAGTHQRELLDRIASRGIIGNARVSRRRIAALDTFIRQQAERLLELPLVDHDKLAADLKRTVPLRASREGATHRLLPHGGARQ